MSAFGFVAFFLFLFSASWFNAQEALRKTEQVDEAKQHFELLIQQQTEQRLQLLGRAWVTSQQVVGGGGGSSDGLGSQRGMNRPPAVKTK